MITEYKDKFIATGIAIEEIKEKIKTTDLELLKLKSKPFDQLNYNRLNILLKRLNDSLAKNIIMKDMYEKRYELEKTIRKNTPEIIEYAKKYNKIYRKKYQKTAKYKLANRKYRSSEEYKEHAKEYRRKYYLEHREKILAVAKIYNHSEKYLEYRRKKEQTAEYKAKKRAYRSTEEFKKHKREWYHRRRKRLNQ